MDVGGVVVFSGFYEHWWLSDWLLLGARELLRGLTPLTVELLLLGWLLQLRG